MKTFAWFVFWTVVVCTVLVAWAALDALTSR